MNHLDQVMVARRNPEGGQVIRLTQSITMPKDNIFIGGGHHIK